MIGCILLSKGYYQTFQALHSKHPGHFAAYTECLVYFPEKEEEYLDMVKYLMSYGEINTGLLAEVAIESGNVRLVRRLHELGIPFNYRNLSYVMSEGYVDIALFLISVGCSCDCDSELTLIL